MPGSQPVQSVMRALRLLETVACAKEGIGLQDLARSLELKPTTVHHLAQTLVGAQYLRKTPSPVRYWVGPALLTLAGTRTEPTWHNQAATLLRRIQTEWPEATLVLAEATSGEVRIVMRLSPERPGVIEQPRQDRSGPYSSASALVFQAFWNEETRQAFRRRYPFEEYGAALWGRLSRLEQFLSQVRRCGYARPPTAPRGLFRVAAPVFSNTQELVAAIGLSWPAGRGSDTSRAQAIAMILQAARELSP